MRNLTLSILRHRFAICKLNPDVKVPDWAIRGDFFSISRTPEELSIICQEDDVPLKVTSKREWRGIKIEGPFHFNEIGILDAITSPIARAKISLLTVSTFDTDYVFIQDSQFEEALLILAESGHQIKSHASG
jgi:hypothetical protein